MNISVYVGKHSWVRFWMKIIQWIVPFRVNRSPCSRSIPPPPFNNHEKWKSPISVLAKSLQNSQHQVHFVNHFFYKTGTSSAVISNIREIGGDIITAWRSSVNISIHFHLVYKKMVKYTNKYCYSTISIQVELCVVVNQLLAFLMEYISICRVQFNSGQL